ncbi:MAG: metalloenzyme [Bacteroidetes bacterium]|nr:metalloenzyme [Bacteroidota bacterium]
MHSTLMVFLDGVGIGKKDEIHNPFFSRKRNFISEIFGDIPHIDNRSLKNSGKYLFPVDACMGVEGLPQSGTGQTSIFCGINAPQFVGKHFGPYPYSTLIPILEEKNIFKTFLDRGDKAFFVNAYPKLFFNYLKAGGRRLSVTSLSCRLSGIRLNTSTDLWKGRALTADIDNRRWNERLKYKLPKISGAAAAKRLIKIAGNNNFTLYEFYLTDHFGHGRNANEKEITLNLLDDFLIHLLQNIPDKMTLLICSDHGNLEDLSIKSHTRNPALTISAGKHAKSLSEKIRSLNQIKDAILELS